MRFLTRFYLTKMRKINRNKVSLSIWDTVQGDLESNTKGDKDLQRVERDKDEVDWKIPLKPRPKDLNQLRTSE